MLINVQLHYPKNLNGTTHCFIYIFSLLYINIYYYLFYLPHDWVRIWEGNFRDGNGMPLYTNPQKLSLIVP